LFASLAGFLAGSGTGSDSPSGGLLQAGGGQLPCLLQPCPYGTAVLFGKGDERETFDISPSHHNHAPIINELFFRGLSKPICR